MFNHEFLKYEYMDIWLNGYMAITIYLVFKTFETFPRASFLQNPALISL